MIMFIVCIMYYYFFLLLRVQWGWVGGVEVGVVNGQGVHEPFKSNVSMSYVLPVQHIPNKQIQNKNVCHRVTDPKAGL